MAEIERARQLNPSSTPILADKGFILAEAGKKEEARSPAHATRSFPSLNLFILINIWREIYFQEGNYPGYFLEMKTLAGLRHDAGAKKKIDAEEKGYRSSGLTGLLEARLHIAEEAFDRGPGSAFDVAAAHAALGQQEDALKYLEYRLSAA